MIEVNILQSFPIIHRLKMPSFQWTAVKINKVKLFNLNLCV